MGIDLGHVALEPVESILAHQDVVDQDLEAYERVFGPLVGMQSPLELGGELPPRAVDVAVVVELLEKARARLASLAESTRSSGDAVRTAGRQAMELTAAHAVLAAEYQPPPLSKGPSPGSAEVAERGAERAEERIRAAAAEQESARVALRDRVQAALSLLGTTTPGGQAVPGDAIPVATSLLKVVSAVEELGPVITEMAQDSMVVEAFAKLELVDQDDMERCYRRMSPRLGSLRQRTVGVLRELEGVPYPFEHAKGSLTLAAFVTDDMPPEELDPTEFHQGAHVLGYVTEVFRRAYGRLALIVEGVEASLGLEPLEPSKTGTPASG